MKIIAKIKRVARKPPRVIAHRVKDILRAELSRFIVPFAKYRFTKKKLLNKTSYKNINQLWQDISRQPYFAQTEPEGFKNYREKFSDDYHIIKTAAKNGIENSINLLGSENIQLGENINWHKDYKTNKIWPRQYYRDINYINLDQPSDVKVPWEISRMQWLIPVAQMYLLTRDERYAIKIKNILVHWIKHNPYARSVNWACTMEVAIRIITWSYFFHVFKTSQAWSDTLFRTEFLLAVYQHCHFVAHNLELSDINGNHLTADAASLVIGGLFFKPLNIAKKWHDLGWHLLCIEIKKQIYSDGVDHEASIAYHRLVTELFFLPALYRLRCGLTIPDYYRYYLINMAKFCEAYCRENGQVPLIGDADDARALPFAAHNINDHRYLFALIGKTFAVNHLINRFSGSVVEIFWLLGEKAALQLTRVKTTSFPQSVAFNHGGFYVLRNREDHVIIDCGPVGLQGRGGHGHNDCLSFEAVLKGCKLITDCGSYVYTADYKQRNYFRSTECHNTPMVDGEEINRFVSEDDLWSLYDDARPIILHWESNNQYATFKGSHNGYARIDGSLDLQRRISLNHHTHALLINDEIKSVNRHDIAIPLHLDPAVKIIKVFSRQVLLECQQQQFSISFSSDKNFTMKLMSGFFSPSYGKKSNIIKIVLFAKAVRQLAIETLIKYTLNG